MTLFALLLRLWPAPQPVFQQVTVEDFVVWPLDPPIFARRLRETAVH